jgi:hypothetical protein
MTSTSRSFCLGLGFGKGGTELRYEIVGIRPTG